MWQQCATGLRFWNSLLPCYRSTVTPLISVQKASKEIKGRPLFTDITFTIVERDRVAIIGPNGAGKSTLLRTIAGELSLDAGQITQRKGARVTYVAQNDSFAPELETVHDAVLSGVASDTHHSAAVTARTLGLAGFPDRNQRIATLSGGWKKRLSIARGIASEPELLLLDEPTNHLDIDGVAWLEETLARLECGVVFISHDRYFIERAARRVIEIDASYPQGLFAVDGNYSDFLTVRAMHRQQSESYRDNLANKVRREVDWLRQGAKARTTKSKSRISEANRMVDELRSLSSIERGASFDFGSTERKTKDLIKVERLGFERSGRILFRDIDVIVRPGSRVGVVGPNGSGKSTLLRCLVGVEQPTSGRVVVANKLAVSWFDQNRTRLDPQQPLAQALAHGGKSVVYQDKEIHIVSWARRFLFRAEQLTVPLGNLSGGEQARVYLAQLMLNKADVLILDEPTNDLDIQTLEVMEDAIDQFDGAVIIVTHDRYLLDKVAEQVIGLDGDGTSGVYASAVQWELARGQKQEGKVSTSAEVSTPASLQPKRKSALTYAERLELQKIEARITTAEAAVIAAQERLVGAKGAELVALSHELAAAQSAVNQLYSRWEELEEKGKASQSSS